MVTQKDIRWYNLALRVAADGYYVRDLHGCVIVRSGTVLALGTNRSAVSHPVSQKFLKCSLHAEQRAIIRCADPVGATLYSARLHRNPSSRPCDMCYALLIDAGVGSVVFHNGAELEREYV